MKNTIRINLKDYKVMVFDTLRYPEAIGLCDYDKQEIHLEIGTLDSMVSTFHHELGHAVAHEYGHMLSQMDTCEGHAELVRVSIECMLQSKVSIEDLKEQFEKENKGE